MKRQSLKPLKKNRKQKENKGLKIEHRGARRSVGLPRVVKKPAINRKRFLFKNMEFDLVRFEAVYRNREVKLSELKQLIGEIPGYNRNVMREIIRRELGIQKFGISFKHLRAGRIFTIIRKYKFYEHFKVAYDKSQQIKKVY